MSYTTFELGQPLIGGDPDDLEVIVPVRNTGPRRGSEVLQLYVAPPRGQRPRPKMELRAFAKVALEPGGTTDALLRLDRRAFARWDPALPGHDELHERLRSNVPAHAVPSGPAAGRWVVDAGTYQLNIGRSAADIVHRVAVVVAGDE